MRAMVIVIVTPGRDQLSGVAQVVEQLFVQALVPEAAIVAFHEAVLHGLSWRDVVPLDLPVFLPFQNGIRCQFGPIIADHDAGIATRSDDIIGLTGNPLAGE